MKLKKDSIRKEIKKLAFEEPKGTLAKSLLFFAFIGLLLNYGLTHFAMYLGYSMDNQIYTTLIHLITLILISPLFLNLINMFLENSKDSLISLKDLFKIKKYSFKFMWFFTLIALGYYLITFIFSLIPLVGFIINIILSIVLIPVFFVIPYIFLEENKLSFKEIINKSFKLISGNRVIFYGTILSFTPWFILGLFTLGILYFWLIPYIFITITYLYLYLKEEKSFKETKVLSNGIIIILFVVGLTLLDIISFILYPVSLYNFKDELGINTLTNSQTVSYGSAKVNFKAPKDYKLVTETTSTKTYTNDSNVLQYTLYLTTVNSAIKMDKDIVDGYKNKDEYKEVKDEEFNLKLNNKNIKGYKYILVKTDNTKSFTHIIYYKKDNLVMTITLTTPKDINKADMKKLITIN